MRSDALWRGKAASRTRGSRRPGQRWKRSKKRSVLRFTQDNDDSDNDNSGNDYDDDGWVNSTESVTYRVSEKTSTSQNQPGRSSVRIVCALKTLASQNQPARSSVTQQRPAAYVSTTAWSASSVNRNTAAVVTFWFG